MPKNKISAPKNERSDAGNQKGPRTPNLEKMARYPASLNHINKNLP